MNIKSAIEESMEKDVVLFVLPSEKYNDFLEKIISFHLKKKNKLGLVSLNKNYSDFLAELKKNKINADKILFIDCVSKKNGNAEEKDNVFHVSSPTAYTEINMMAKKAFKAGVQNIIFDSLSKLLIHGDNSLVYKYIQDLIMFARDNKKKLFFILLEEDYDKKIVKQIQEIVDKEINLGEEISSAETDTAGLIEKFYPIIKENLKKNVVLFVSPSEKYAHFLEKIISLQLEKKEKTSLVSLNKNYVNFSAELKKNKINADKILFIDCVSKKKGNVEEKDNVLYVSSPTAYTEINITAKKAFKSGIESAIFDSLSKLLISGNHSLVYKYIQDLITFVRGNKKKVFFILLEDDYEKKVVERMQDIVDKEIVLGRKISLVKIDAANLMESLFGFQASKLVDKSTRKEKKTNLFLQEFDDILSELVGPKNADKQVKELYEKYV